MSSQTKPKELTVQGELSTRGRGLMSYGADTLSQAVQRGFYNAAFYLREDVGYELVTIRIWDECSACCGSGTVRKKSRTLFATKPCPSCKGGKLKGDTLLELTLDRRELHDSHLKIVDTH